MVKKDNKVVAPKEIKTKSVYDIAAYGYQVASAYFAKYRLVSYIYDGMKPSYRRVIIGAYEVCPDKFVNTSTVTGYVLGRYHPHNLDVLDDVVAELVHAGILLGDGEFGSKYLDGTSARAAASRYTEIMLNPEYKKMFDKILPYVPKIDGEKDHKEYAYIPMPLPFACNRGSFALGPGLSVNTPALTMSSMLDAYLRDDPNLLKSTYGYKIIDRKDSINRMWTQGKGSIYYALKVTRKTLGDISGAMIEGSADVFTPDLEKLDSWRKNGWVTINEVGSGGKSKLFVGRNKGVTQISENDIYNELLRVSVNRSMVLIKTIAPDGVVHPISLKTWIQESINNFIKLNEKYKNGKIKEIEHKIELLKVLEKVKNCIIDHLKDPKFKVEDIAKTTGVEISLVKEIDKWSISKLRNTVPAKEIKKLEEELKKVKALDSTKITYDFIRKVDVSEEELSVATEKLQLENSDEVEDVNLDDTDIDMFDETDENVEEDD